MPLFRLTNGRAFGPYGRFGVTDIDQTLGFRRGKPFWESWFGAAAIF